MSSRKTAGRVPISGHPHSCGGRASSHGTLAASTTTAAEISEARILNRKMHTATKNGATYVTASPAAGTTRASGSKRTRHQNRALARSLRRGNGYSSNHETT